MYRSELLGLTLLIVGLGLGFLLLFQFYVVFRKYRIKRNKQKNFERNYSLLKDFCINYNLMRVPNNAIVKTNTANFKECYYELHFPHWKYENIDKTQDKRMNYNRIIWENSYLYSGHYIISFKNPLSLMNCVYELRKNNIDVKKSYYEIEKIDKLKNEYNTQINLESLQDLIKSYSSHPTDFEHYCANLFKSIGYDTIITPPTNDGGYDIKVLNNSNLYALVECKLFNKTTVGRPLIQKLVGANALENSPNLIFITTSNFSKEAIEYAKSTHVQLIDGNSLIHLSKSIKSQENKTSFDENKVQLSLNDFSKYIPHDILDICYKEM